MARRPDGRRHVVGKVQVVTRIGEGAEEKERRGADAQPAHIQHLVPPREGVAEIAARRAGDVGIDIFAQQPVDIEPAAPDTLLWILPSTSYEPARLGEASGSNSARAG